MPYSMQLTEQIPNDPPRMGAKVLQLAIIPVPLLSLKLIAFNQIKFQVATCICFNYTYVCGRSMEVQLFYYILTAIWNFEPQKFHDHVSERHVS